MSDQPETMELAGFLFAVAGSTTDAAGYTIQIPGACLGKAPKQSKPTRSGPTVASAPNTHAASAPTTAPAPRHTPAARPQAAPAPAPQQTIPARKQAAPHGQQYWKSRQTAKPFHRKPTPIVIPSEPWTAGQWAALIVTLALALACIVAWNSGGEMHKWERIPATRGR